MWGTVIVVVLTLSMATGQFPGALPECLQSAEMESCIRPIIESPAASASMSGAVPTLTESTLREFCGLFENATHCISEYIGNCGPEILTLFRGFEAALDYLCIERFDDYLRLASCVGGPESIADTQRCMLDMVHRLNTHMVQGAPVPTDVCKEIHSYETCIIRAEQEDCGSTAAEIYSGVFGKFEQPLRQMLNCNGPRTTVPYRPRIEPGIVENNQEENIPPVQDLPCNTDQLRRCMQHVERLLLPGDLLSHFINIDTTCRVISEALDCVSTYTVGCTDVNMLTIMRGVHSHACSAKNIARFRSARTCFQRIQTEPSRVKSCFSQDSRGMCRVNPYSSRTCLLNVVGRSCSMDIGHLLFDFLGELESAHGSDIIFPCSVLPNSQDHEIEDPPMLEPHLPDESHYGDCMNSMRCFEMMQPRMEQIMMNGAIDTDYLKGEFCPDTELAMDCYVSRGGCGDQHTGTIKMARDAHRYVCEEHFDEFKENIDCYVELFTSNEIQNECLVKFNDLTSLGMNGSLCPVLQEAGACSMEKVEEKCGCDAYNFLAELSNQLLVGLMKAFSPNTRRAIGDNCVLSLPLHGDRHHHGHHGHHRARKIGLAVGLSVGAILLAVIIGCVVHHCNRRRRPHREVPEGRANLVANDLLQNNLKIQGKLEFLGGQDEKKKIYDTSDLPSVI